MLSAAVAATMACAWSAPPVVAAGGVRSWGEPYAATGARGSDPILAGGRVWWVTRSGDRGASLESYELVSRAAAGGDRRSVPITLPPHPSIAIPENQGFGWIAALEPDAIAIVGNRLIVSTQWLAVNGDPKGGATAATPFVATFDTRTGAPGATFGGDDRVVRAVPGTDIAHIGQVASLDGRTNVSVVDPPLPIPPQAVAAGAGRFTLSFVGTSAAGEGSLSPPSWRIAEVRRRDTNALVYRVTARALARAAVPTHADGTVSIDRLLSDGALAVTARRRSPNGRPQVRRGLRPVAVTSTGRVLRLGRVQPRAMFASALVAGGRGLVRLSFNGTSDHECDGSWLINGTGTRGRPYARPGLRRGGTPVAWTGDVAVWPRGEIDPEDLYLGYGGHRYVTVDHDLKHASLTSSNRPRC